MNHGDSLALTQPERTALHHAFTLAASHASHTSERAAKLDDLLALVSRIAAAHAEEAASLALLEARVAVDAAFSSDRAAVA